jgi:hypothetical protein
MAVAALLLVAAAGLPGRAQPPERQGQQSPQPQQQVIQPNATLVERLRRLLNLSPPLAVGGSRSGAVEGVCLLSPWSGRTGRSRGMGEQLPAIAVVPTATPTLLSSGPLNELQLLRNNRIVWQQRASSVEPISGPMTWPLPPLRPGEQVLLRLRPRGAGGGDFAEIRMQAADAAVLQRHQSLLTMLQANPSRWQTAIEQELSSNPAMAVALASDPSAPPGIQQALVEAGGCGGGQASSP